MWRRRAPTGRGCGYGVRYTIPHEHDHFSLMKRFANTQSMYPHLITFLALCGISASLATAAEKLEWPAGGGQVPPVQMLVPGFSVQALPVEIAAINVVRYRADGKLVALGYDGKVWLLSDNNSDGIEDKAQVFYDPGRQVLSLGMALTPPGYARGQGVFIARKGALVLEVDTDGDDRADREIIVAKDWETPKRFPGGASDAIGVALDADGNVFFGLGAANSQNGYLLEDGVAHYRITSERGTIMRIPPDFSRREIVATGIRASVGLAFNAAGDLFCTDQEGATWMPNGNPFDELLHIEGGRHFGFPPRHPKHLPKVVDEPSVCDYGPQHQSTCGLQFNESVNGGPVFGPQWWGGDALVAGESRGKIYRTKLVKTSAGYVAQNQIIACLSWLTIDQCVTAQGGLLVACHSGPDDWGNGPNAIGRLFKITRTDPLAPQPVLAYAASATETRIVFDRPLATDALREIVKRTKLTEGYFVREGDRFESFRPGYRVVGLQQASPRRHVPVLNARLGDDQASLILQTPERREAVTTAVDIDDWPRAASAAADELSQKAVLGVAMDQSGVMAEWMAQDGKESWSGWLPHFDLDIARSLTSPSAEHVRLWRLLERPGTLKLRGQLDLWNLLRPAIQPGEKLDYTLPPELVSISFASDPGVRVQTGAFAPAPTQLETEAGITLRSIPAKPRVWLPLELTLPTDGKIAPTLRVSWRTEQDGRPRPFALRRVLVPWAIPPDEPVKPASPPELAGGDRAKGEQLFASVCAVCHAVNGKGGQAGPDLSNLVYRDYASVVNDIADPNASLNPDHIAFIITMKTGEAHLGVVIEDMSDRLLLAGLAGPPIAVKKADIAEMKASPVSLMPAGFDKALGSQGMKDLLTYLMLPVSEVVKPQTQ